MARLLAQDQVAVCASGCFSAAQALIAAKSNVSYVAPAVGPLDDVGSIGMDLVEQIIRVYDNYGFQTQILVSDAAQPGPRSRRRADGRRRRRDLAGPVIEQLFRHPLSDEILASRGAMKTSADRFSTCRASSLKKLKDNRT